MKTKKNIPIHKILIAIDGSSYSDHLIDYGMQLAKQMNAELAVVHINELPLSMPFMVDPLTTESSSMTVEVMQAQDEANKKLFAYVQKNWGKEISLHTYAKMGKPKDEILNTAQEYQADLLILGTHGRVGFDHLISGSVAEGVIRNATCPVLVIPNKSVPKKTVS